MNEIPTREQLMTLDIRRAWRRGYIEGFQVALLASKGAMNAQTWDELSRWVQTELVKWRFGPIDKDTQPPQPPAEHIDEL